MDKLYFKEKLSEGIIKSKNSQFVMMAELNGKIFRSHCPTTGRIGNIEVNGRPCLLSRSENTKRKTEYTVEAISLNNFEDKNKNWIGINQNSINKYVEYYLINNCFNDMIETSNCKIMREQVVGSSKLDFLIGNTYIEIKMPLQFLQIDIPDYVKIKKISQFDSTDRFIKHMNELGKSLKNNERAILLTCFMYDNPGFRVIKHSKNYDKVSKIVKKNVSLGVELWQANFEINEKYVVLKNYKRFYI